MCCLSQVYSGRLLVTADAASNLRPHLLADTSNLLTQQGDTRQDRCNMWAIHKGCGLDSFPSRGVLSII